jgi:hypothetical protein
MGHPTGTSPHHSWASRRRPISEILPDFMDHPMSAQRFVLHGYNLRIITGLMMHDVWVCLKCHGNISSGLTFCTRIDGAVSRAVYPEMGPMNYFRTHNTHIHKHTGIPVRVMHTEIFLHSHSTQEYEAVSRDWVWKWVRK